MVNLDHGLADDTLVARAQQGDRRAERALLLRYKPLVRNRCRAYYLEGADPDDLLQEGLIGLHKAIRDFHAGRGLTFQRFAILCISRNVVSAIRQATRQKHMPLAGYAALTGEEPSPQPLALLDASDEADPHEALLAHDGLEWVKSMLRMHLSGFEQQVLALYLWGRLTGRLEGHWRRMRKPSTMRLPASRRRAERSSSRWRFNSETRAVLAPRLRLHSEHPSVARVPA